MALKKLAGLAKALILSYMITGVILLLLTLLLYRFGMGGNIVSVGVVAAYLLSCFAGGFFLGRRKGERKFLWGALLGGIYFIVLVIISLVMYKGVQGEIGNFFTTLVMCVGSGMIGGMAG